MTGIVKKNEKILITFNPHRILVNYEKTNESEDELEQIRKLGGI